MRALLGLRVWTGLVEACFTRKWPRFAPATQISKIDHFEPFAGVPPRLRRMSAQHGGPCNPGDFEHDWGWNRVDFDLVYTDLGPVLLKLADFARSIFTPLLGGFTA